MLLFGQALAAVRFRYLPSHIGCSSKLGASLHYLNIGASDDVTESVIVIPKVVKGEIQLVKRRAEQA